MRRNQWLEKHRIVRKSMMAGLLCTFGAGFAALVAQETPGNPPVAAPVRAQPVSPGTPGANPSPASPVPTAPREGVPAMDPRPYAPPPPPTLPPGSGSIIPGAPAKTPEGVTVSPLKMDSEAIEVFRPQRVKVFPDDPNSAWWEINPHYAFSRAQREQKPLLLLFTGIWNDQAMALSKEVFSTRSFNDFVKENLVICYLNYERNITDTPDVLRRIKEKFKVMGYPNVLLFNPNGEVEKGIRGYKPGRPVDYFNELRAACLPILQSIETNKAALLRRGYRDWSNYLGKIIFAKFVEHDGVHVRLQDVSGQRWLIKKNDLAPDDQKLVESFPAVDIFETPVESSP